MTITLCGSIAFLEEMKKVKQELLTLGVDKVYIPEESGGNEAERKEKNTNEENGQAKIKRDLINKHYRKIMKSNCILVLNYNKKGIENYIGGNTLLEMGFAFVNKKRIYLMRPIPDLSYTPEIIGMKPKIINENIKLVMGKAK